MKGFPLVRIKGVKKGFKNKQVLSSLNLDIKDKEILGIIGASGIGKTTLLRLIIGFTLPEQGGIFFKRDGTELEEKTIMFNDEIGFATQDSSFYPDLTVSENLRYFAALHSIHDDMEERISRTLRLVDLKGEENHPAKDLSDGMKKRLDLACALIHEPRLLILDEPTANIDISLKKQIWNLLKKINKKGITVVFSSHYLEEVESLCSRIAIIHDKKIAAIGTIKELKKKFSLKTKQKLDDVFESIVKK